MKKQPNNNNNVETRKDIEEDTKRILLAEEGDDPEQVSINITPDMHDKLAANSQGITHFIGRSF